MWVTIAPFVTWAVLRLTGWQPGFRWIQLVAFTPYVAAASFAVPVAAAALRRWLAALAALVTAGALAVAVLPRMTAERDPAASGPELRVLAANLRAGRTPPRDVLAMVIRFRPHVFAVQELTPGTAAGLERARLRSLLPYGVVRARDGVGGSAVYARYPLAELPAIQFGGFGQARASVTVPGAAPLEVVSVHPCAPSGPSRAACWRAGLRALPPADRRGPVRILAGDFNATADHLEFRRVIGAGYRDAAEATGAGLRTTWPYLGRRARYTPKVALDHVLVDRRVAVHGFGTLTLPATDHRAILAELTLPT